MFDPWGVIDAIPYLKVVIVLLPAGIAGCTDGKRIYLDERLNMRERRCVLTHELMHVISGHSSVQYGCMETGIRERTARKLIRMDALREALLWSGSVHEVAEELHVTVTVLNGGARNGATSSARAPGGRRR